MIPFLSRKEEEVYMTLLKRDATIQELSEELRRPRSSLLLLLRSLEKQGLARRIRLGRRNIWQAANPRNILKLAQEQLNATREILPTLVAEQGAGRSGSSVPEIRIYESQRGLRIVYDSILTLRKGEKVFTLEGSKSVESKLRLLPLSYITKWQKVLKQKSLILESVISESSVRLLAGSAKRLIEPHIGRPMITHVVADSRLCMDLDIILYGRNAAFIDIQRNLATVITDEKIKQSLQLLFDLTKAGATQIDLNRILVQASP